MAPPPQKQWGLTGSSLHRIVANGRVRQPILPSEFGGVWNEGTW